MLFSMLFTLLLPALVASQATIIDNGNLLDHVRRLDQVQNTGPFEPTRECNSRIGTVTVDQVKSVFEIFLLELFPTDTEFEQFRSAGRSISADNAKYDVAVFKICGSCSDFASGTSVSEDAPYQFTDYCADTAYAANTVRCTEKVALLSYLGITHQPRPYAILSFGAFALLIVTRTCTTNYVFVCHPSLLLRFAVRL